MWPSLSSDHEIATKVDTFDQFSEELKKKWLTVNRLGTKRNEAAPEDCVVCSASSSANVLLDRKCKSSTYCCGGPVCKCAQRQVCLDCAMRMLWESKGLPGRYRSKCAVCRAEFCHLDLCTIEYLKDTVEEDEDETEPKRLPSRYLFTRQLSPEELHMVDTFGRSDPEMERVDQLIAEFVASDEEETQLPANLSAPERKYAHAAADMAGLGHESRGPKKKRQMYLSKDPSALKSEAPRKLNADEIEEALYFKGYISFTGPLVTACGRQFEGEAVKEKFVEWKKHRDGTAAGHITIVNRNEVQRLKKERNLTGLQLLKEIADTLEDDWQFVGLGKVQQEYNVTFFAVINWPSAQRARKQLGLPAHDFHRTIGFNKKDIHNVRKDKSTLI